MNITNNRGAFTMEKNENIGTWVKFNLRGIERVLEGEEIIDAISGLVDRTMAGVKQKEESAALVLAPTRVILYHNKMFLKGHSSIDFPLNRINSVELNSGMIYAEVKIHSGSDLLIIKNAAKKDGERFSKNLKTFVSRINNPTSTNQSIQTSPDTQSSPASPGPNVDIADQIKKLADLKAQGFLTEEEFTAQKKKLLGL